MLQNQVELAGKEAAQLKAGKRRIPLCTNVIMAGRADYLTIRKILSGLLKHDISTPIRVWVACPLIALHRISGEKRDLRIEDVENEPAVLRDMALYTIEDLLQGSCIAKKLKGIKRHDDDRKVPAKIEVTAVGLNPVDSYTLILRLAFRLFEHRGGDIETDDFHSRCRQRDRHAPCAAADFQHGSVRRSGLRKIE